MKKLSFASLAFKKVSKKKNNYKGKYEGKYWKIENNIRKNILR